MPEDAQTLSTLWSDARTVGPPLIQHLRNHSANREEFSEWVWTLRSLNKSWYHEATSHIRKVTAVADALVQLSSSLVGSLAHVTDLEIKEIGFSVLAFDELEGSLCMASPFQLHDALNSAGNVEVLDLEFVPDHAPDNVSNLIPLTTLKTLKLTEAGCLDLVGKCPNIEDLWLENCCMTSAPSAWPPRLQYLTISSPGIEDTDVGSDVAPLLLTGIRPLGRSFVEGLATSTLLTDLRLTCQLSDWKARFPAIRAAFQGLVALERLAVIVTHTFVVAESDDDVKKGLLDVLPASLRELEVLGLFSCMDTEVLLRDTTRLGALEKLTLGNGLGTMGYPELEWLSALPPGLVELSLVGAIAKGRAFAWLRKLPELRHVTLNLHTIEPEAFQQLRWVGDKVELIEIWCRVSALDEDPLCAAAMQSLKDRGVDVCLVVHPG